MMTLSPYEAIKADIPIHDVILENNTCSLWQRAPSGNQLQACKHCYKMQGTEKPCLIFVLLETNAAELYKEVKRATDSYQGIPSQCFVADKAGIAGRPKQGNARAQYCANLAMKINAKLGGRNWSLLRQCEIPSIASVMVLGQNAMLINASRQGSKLAHIGSYHPCTELQREVLEACKETGAGSDAW
ncbi:hypothetical protein WJX84_009476 [Apatococcus fuscideae]|uniref:Piwi domain-containing protein n=1 Tax=Apatococcus fuscideae TaxID=2026836 RepID=A0AAW1SRV0_9CHLO